MKLNPTNRYCLVHSLQEELQIKEKMLHGRMSPMQLIPLGLRRELSQKLKKKWFDIKVLAKKRVTAHRREMSATGGGQTTTELSPLDNRIACIIGDTALSGITKDGDTDALATEQTGPSNTQSEGKINQLE